MRFVSRILVVMQLAVLLVLPALANGIAAGTISVEPPTVDVNVGSIFTVDIQTSGPPQYAGGIHFKITWDDSLTHGTEVNFYVTSLGCHFSSGFPIIDEGTVEIQAFKDSGYLTGVATWVTLEFRCVGAGVSSISIDPYSHWILVSVDEPFLTVNFATCNQRQPAPPSGLSGHVGGEVFSANKLAVLSPYLALIGLAGVVASAALVVKRRKL